MLRSALLLAALLALAGCNPKNAGPPPKPPIPRPELNVNLKEKLGQEVEVTGVLVAVSVQATKERDQWVGETTATLECKGVTLTCEFPKAAKAPLVLVPGVVDTRLVTVRGTVVSAEPAGAATLSDCVVVSDPHKP